MDGESAVATESGHQPSQKHDQDSAAERASRDNHASYWRSNLRLMAALLAVWFIVPFGLGIVFVEPLNEFHLGGFPLGFWFAQQGSIYVFVILILIYVKAMNRLDARFGVTEEDG